LNDKQRRLLLQMKAENKAQDEIAAVIGVTQQTISYQLKLLQGHRTRPTALLFTYA
jgi:predicted transcriptional regulator